jgi:hypothetical protein
MWHFGQRQRRRERERKNVQEVIHRESHEFDGKCYVDDVVSGKRVTIKPALRSRNTILISGYIGSVYKGKETERRSIGFRMTFIIFFIYSRIKLIALSMALDIMFTELSGLRIRSTLLWLIL